MVNMPAKLDPEDDFLNIPSKDLDNEEGSAFGWFDRMLFGWRDGFVYDYGDWEARDITEMMAKDYKARQLENVLSLPLISARHQIEKPSGSQNGKKEYEWLEQFWSLDHHDGGTKTTLDEIITQMTSAITYKRAYFEKVWTRGVGANEGKIVYDKLAWRPQTTCRLMRDPKNGNLMGFEQMAYYVGPEITSGHWPIKIFKKRAFVYIHGTRRDPLNGTSDMEIAYWCWKMKQKVLFLWFQFLEGVSLPRVLVKANDMGVATQIAKQISRLKGSGILPMGMPSGPDSVTIDTMDISGKGAEQFQQAITWLDNAATNAVLAGFLNLTDMSNGGTGSYSLSKNAADFFLQMEEAKAREIEMVINRDLFGPLIRVNFGKSAFVPKFKFEPLNDIDRDISVQLLQSAISSRSMSMGGPAGSSVIPAEFISELAGQVAQYVGLDPKKVQKAFDAEAKKSAAAAKAAGAATAGMPGAPEMEGAVNAASSLMSSGQGSEGKPPGYDQVAAQFGAS